MLKFHPTELQTTLQIRQPCLFLPAASTQALPGKKVNIVKWYSYSRSTFSRGKIVLFHLAKILTGFSSQKESTLA